ncbi:hypothetical protein D3C87_1386490 [compost metagenome]
MAINLALSVLSLIIVSAAPTVPDKQTALKLLVAVKKKFSLLPVATEFNTGSNTRRRSALTASSLTFGLILSSNKYSACAI